MAVFEENAKIAGPGRLAIHVRLVTDPHAISVGIWLIVQEKANLQFEVDVPIDVSALMPPEDRCWAIIPMGATLIFSKPGLNPALLPDSHLDTWAKVHNSRRSVSS